MHCRRREPLYQEHGAIGICRCHRCSLMYVSPRLEPPEQNYWGDADKYVEESRLIFKDKSPDHRDPNYKEEGGGEWRLLTVIMGGATVCRPC